MIPEEMIIKDRSKVRYCGVYCIYNKINGKYYIGSSINICNRLTQHLCDLRHNRHSSDHLQHAYNIYGESSLVFCHPIKMDNREDALNLEQYLIDLLDCCDRDVGYNICPDASGSRHSEETKRKLSNTILARRGIKKETCDTVIRLYNNGTKTQEMVKIVDLNIKTIYAILKRNNISLRRNKNANS